MLRAIRGHIVENKERQVADAAVDKGWATLLRRNGDEVVARWSEAAARSLEGARGVKKDAAELMGISQRALSYYLSKYRID